MTAPAAPTMCTSESDVSSIFFLQPVNRTLSQKLASLFEPPEPGRREFIEAVLRYWEEKEIPLKNAPLMGRKTLDLFRLYHIVKQNGGMPEVMTE